MNRMLPYTIEQVSHYIEAATGTDTALANYTGSAGYDEAICDYNTFFAAMAVITGTKSVNCDAIEAKLDPVILTAIRCDMAEFFA